MSQQRTRLRLSISEGVSAKKAVAQVDSICDRVAATMQPEAGVAGSKCGHGACADEDVQLRYPLSAGGDGRLRRLPIERCWRWCLSTSRARLRRLPTNRLAGGGVS